MSAAAGAMRASVYRMAAGGSGSMEPKLPCGSTMGTRMRQSCAMPTIVP
jgi:hypothetical protein